jgi:hypothetical protein
MNQASRTHAVPTEARNPEQRERGLVGRCVVVTIIVLTPAIDDAINKLTGNNERDQPQRLVAHRTAAGL